jgi:hypothetical protein
MGIWCGGVDVLRGHLGNLHGINSVCTCFKEIFETHIKIYLERGSTALDSYRIIFQVFFSTHLKKKMFYIQGIC